MKILVAGASGATSAEPVTVDALNPNSVPRPRRTRLRDTEAGVVAMRHLDGEVTP